MDIVGIADAKSGTQYLNERFSHNICVTALNLRFEFASLQADYASLRPALRICVEAKNESGKGLLPVTIMGRCSMVAAEAQLDVGYHRAPISIVV